LALSVQPAGAVTNGDPDGVAHDNVGALIFHVPGSPGYQLGCSGSLLSVGGKYEAAFLTAGHCVFGMTYGFPEGTEYAVSFDSDLKVDSDGFVNPATQIPVVEWSMNPAYTLKGANHRDVGVLYLESAPPGLEPVTLPELDAADAVVGSDVLSVGYGATTLDRRWPSPNSNIGFTDVRTSGTTRVDGISPNWLNATSPSAACYGDSGGPQFTATGVEISITISSSGPCMSLTKSQRLDVQDVLTWLDQQM
jgi:hypothetical protein